MKLYYTDIENDLTALLANQALYFANQGKRVFYIAPNSLSFEKEKKVLQFLPNQVSIDIMVTRFAQLARYFVWNDTNSQEKPIDDRGLTMLFYRTLSQFEDGQLKVYGKLKQDAAFIQQLVSLYKELLHARMTISDLESLHSTEKKEDLILIFSSFLDLLGSKQYEKQTKVSYFRQLIESGQLDQQLSDVVIIIDGFSQFTADEESLIDSLNSRVTEIVIGTYASRKALHAAYIEGNIYQASVEFLNHLSTTFNSKPNYVSATAVTEQFVPISRAVEATYAYTELKSPLTKEEVASLEIWEVTNQKEEVEEVAKAIRKLVHKGARYKDILLLVGDEASYGLQIGKLFERYEIPFYFGKTEEMSHHPLVHFVESLGRIKTYHYRGEDLINLLKTGLFGHIPQDELDQFEQYILFADCKGQAAFSRPFSVNSRARYDLDKLNNLREEVMLPLQTFLKSKPQTGNSLLQKFTAFLEEINLTENMFLLSQQSENDGEQEKREEVWKVFCQILEEFQYIFGHEKLKVEDFLSLLVSGMQASHYRTVPATVDVVHVKSYHMVEPHSAKYVYAIGLSQSNFPKPASSKGILTEEEKTIINQLSEKNARFDLVSKDNLKRSHRTMLSLLNAATDYLVLSSPQLYNESEESLSPYLKLLKELGVITIDKGRQTKKISDDIGHYKGLLSQIIELNRHVIKEEWSKEEETFWSVALRYLRKKLEQEGMEIPTITGNLSSYPLSEETLSVLYPKQVPLRLSASSLTDFYQNEYLYFIKHVLHLQEKESIHPDARSHGNFLHRIFERVTMDHSEQSFDEKLSNAIHETRREQDFESLYRSSADGQFSEQILIDIARASSLVLRQAQDVEVLANEAVFGKEEDSFRELVDGRNIQISGKIDRLDRLVSDQSLGVVDYKSSNRSFKVDSFYNGLSPQLVTYLAAVQDLPVFSQSEKIFGAMYLHLLDPIVKLADSKGADDVLAEAYKSLVYKGLFIEEESNRLNQLYYKTKASLYSREELDVLLSYNEVLYKKAANRILNGYFAINPYTENGRSVAGEQLKSITGFEANRHMSQARLLTKGGKREDWLERMKEAIKK